ncbi:(2Fe-2S) ferredoxin [Acidocella aquatica]|uniref:(2Fe-2S) ferredoxin n=1 Tax=Acidocella aquatica TaxID=1922313 RepID=A0ABQ6A8H5_9PROT|nr:2Fe-2S iron-sulfur cluster-binding protein [Acidocella aquatica]GLR66434.1 (2Fe-2S) ferredoxin [Acidocella aquatica]
MPKIKYITHDGKEYDVDAHEGASVMEAATSSNVPGIDGDCGGALACGTCHIYVDPAWFAKAGTPAQDAEQEMLSLLDNRQDNSRLSCQISMSAELDGLVVRLPRGQH